MIKDFFRKRGEITSQQIVILIIVIASFAVILFFLFRLNLGETSNEELCYNSVVTRGASVVSSDTIPLNCHRKYLCVTEDGSCEGLTNPEIEKVNSLDRVYEILAEEMATCWWMFGEARIDYVGGKFEKDNYCSICTQVYFDDSLSNIESVGDSIDKEGLYKFLQNKKYDESNNYTDYLFGVSTIDKIKAKALEVNDKTTLGKIEVGKHYFVVTGITSEVSLWSWTGKGAAYGGAFAFGGAVIGTIALASNPVGWVTGIALVGTGAGAGTVVGTIKDLVDPEISIISVNGRGVDNNFMAPTIVEANSERFNALNCEEILTLA
ncbi:MAG: hypothetical protein OQK82_00345 [Candidatus Pacearchaeota archaeon]|nr:hypothetical protein [Candidatus Pacearchaeota archaeon]